MSRSKVRVTITKDNDSVVWEGSAALVVVMRDEPGNTPLPLVSIRGGPEASLVMGLGYLMAQVRNEVHPAAIGAALSGLAALPTMRREP